MRPRTVLSEPAFSVQGSRASSTEVVPRTELRIEPPSSGEAAAKGVWLADLYRRPELLVRPPELFPGIAYRGRHTLFAGREKLGKSELLGLVCARAEGGTPICYFSFEEATGDLVARMKRYGADPTRIWIVEGIKSVEDVRHHIREQGAGLALIDSLSSLLKRQLRVTASENSDEWGTWVEHLTHLAHDLDVGLVTTHHANRESGTFRGHSSIAAAPDLVAEMFAVKTSSEERRFSVVGRVRGVAVPKLRWTGTVYTLEGDSEDESVRGDVRNVLSATPRLSMNQLLGKVNRRRNQVARVVNQMLATGEILDLNENPSNRSLVNADEGARFPQTDVKS